MKPYSFHNLLKALKPSLEWETLEGLYEGLLGLYKEPHRVYHTWKHIEEGWKELDSVRYLFKDPPEAEFAWYYHDCMYLPGDTLNEERSAKIADVVCAEQGLNGSFRGTVRDFIIKSGSMADTEDLRLFHDIDYSILGQKSSRYAQYRDGILTEYRDSPVTGRVDFLKNLQQKGIYLTSFFKDKYEKTALKNIALELKVLEAFKNLPS